MSPSAVMFWSGAGISADDPTGGPTGRALTDRALDHYFAFGTKGVLAHLYQLLDVPNAAFRPRLETVLDALSDTYGLDGLRDVLSDLASAAPNRHHAFFARHAAAGGRHVTANFDTCIERAGADVRVADQRRIIHIHGALDEKDDLSALGARLQVIQDGFPPVLVDRLSATLSSTELRVLMFIGYSGSDFFDATPYLLSQVACLRRRIVVWYEWSREPLCWGVEPAGVHRDLLTRLVAAGVDVQVVSGPLDDLLAPMSVAWQLATPPPVTAGRPTPWTARLERSDAQRHAASAALYARMGYRKGVIEAFSRHRPESSTDWDRLADAYWGAGRYSEAHAAWEHAFAAADPDSQLRLVERRGAIRWIRGELLAAERLLWKAILTWCVPESAAAPASLAVLLETYGRVVEHMKRVPDARWFVRTGRVAVVRKRIADVQADLAGREGVAVRARLSNIAAALDGQPDEQLVDHMAAFVESEALHSWLNYEHAYLRRCASHPTDDHPAPSRADYERQAHRQATIGATADVARTYLLPHAARFFTPREIAAAFRPVEMTRWHRVRLIGGFTAYWLLARLRKLLAILRWDERASHREVANLTIRH